MKKLSIDQNCQTQPLRSYPIFNNWDVIAKAWYFVCPSKSLKTKQAKSFDVCGQRLVFYRGEDGRVRALDGFCPHMGVDLGIGSVEKNHLKCFFHHWQFNEHGENVSIPCQDQPSSQAKLQSYQVEETLGYIWVYPDKKAHTPFLEIPDLKGIELDYKFGKMYQRSCHHHITMINGIDPQHLKTVHDIHIDMNLEIDEKNSHQIEFQLSGKIEGVNFKEKIAKFFLGENYAYSMKYADGTVANLTVNKNVLLFGKYPILPRFYMYFAYRTEQRGVTSVLPIYVTKKRAGFGGKFVSNLSLWVTKRLFMALQDEDGQVYENIRFRADHLLKLDAPVARYIQFINKLSPSIWGKKTKDSFEPSE